MTDPAQLEPVIVAKNVVVEPPDPYHITFTNKQEQIVGKLTIHDDKLSFEGSPDEAAVVFFDSLIALHIQKLSEREKLIAKRAYLAGQKDMFSELSDNQLFAIIDDMNRKMDISLEENKITKSVDT